jgi:hypothetical protein
MSPEDFALILANDFDTPHSQQFIPMIAEAIRQQVVLYAGAVEDDVLEPITYEKPEIIQNSDPKPIENPETAPMEVEASQEDISKQSEIVNGTDNGDFSATQLDIPKEPIETRIETKDDLSYGDIRIVIKVLENNVAGFTCWFLVPKGPI